MKHGQHYQYPTWGKRDPFVRFLTPDDGDDGKPAGGSGGAGGQVSMSQAAFDAIVRDRVAQAERSVKAEIEAKYGDLAELKAKADGAEAAMAELKQKAQDLETKVAEFQTKEQAAARRDLQQRVAKDANLPADLAERLAGDDEDAMKADAERLAKIVGATKPGTPGPTAPADGADHGQPADLASAVAESYKGVLPAE